MSHVVFSQGKFVFAIFACDHEFLASDDASSLRELPTTWRTLTSTRVQTENMIKFNKIAAILYIKYLVGGGNEFLL